MIFKYKVKHNGITYPAGADVPVGETPAPEKPVVKETVETEKPAPKATPKKKTKK